MSIAQLSTSLSFDTVADRYQAAFGTGIKTDNGSIRIPVESVGALECSPELYEPLSGFGLPSTPIHARLDCDAKLKGPGVSSEIADFWASVLEVTSSLPDTSALARETEYETESWILWVPGTFYLSGSSAQFDPVLERWSDWERLSFNIDDGSTWPWLRFGTPENSAVDEQTFAVEARRISRQAGAPAYSALLQELQSYEELPFEIEHEKGITEETIAARLTCRDSLAQYVELAETASPGWFLAELQRRVSELDNAYDAASV